MVTPVVVVQAEDTPQGTMVGLRDARGGSMWSLSQRWSC
jgi:hypothetical protein